MDLQTGLVCVVLVILSGAILLIISMFGMKEKTYEEAIAEQRKMPDDALILGRPGKDKKKEKKLKRLGKKVKEKHALNKQSSNKLMDKKQYSNEMTSAFEENEHTHVNFVTPEAQVLNKVILPQPDEKQKNKKEKIKPILINKEEPVIIKEKLKFKDVTVNHFTEIIPKDDLQLKLATNKINHDLNNSNSSQINSKENSNEKEKGKERGKSVTNNASKESNKIENVKNQKNETKNISHALKMQKIEKMKSDLQQPQQQLNPPQLIKTEVSKSAPNSSIEQSPIKKLSNQTLNNKEQKPKKFKKSELTSLQQMNESVNIQLLIPLIRKAELSRTEVQVLTDILLTKHFDEVSDHFEWIEGRQDPVVKLKKQLAEKEKALSEEQEASQAFQNKLRELRLEYNAERARLTQACRQYDETILAKQGEIQNLHATNRHLMDSHVAEKQALTQKIQQLQAQVNDENMVIRKLQEDHGQTQNALQQELVNQRQQMEMHIGRLSEQLQEAQKNLEAQIHAKIQEAEQIRASFNAEIQKNRRYEEELRDLREQNVSSQNKIKNLESRASQLKESSNHSQELVRQIEEFQRANKELEKRLNNALQSEEELKFEKSKLQNEILSFTNRVSELQSECEKLTREKEKLSSQMTSKLDLEKDILKIKEENQSLISQVSFFTKIEREAQQLREENENLAAQVTAFTERPAADGRENGDSPYNEEKNKNINVEFLNRENNSKQKDAIIEKLSNDLKQKEIFVEKLNSELNNYQSEISTLSSEIAKYKTEVSKLKEELDAQRNKNNDLRQKNWKAMDALTSTEKSLESKVRETEKLGQHRLQQEQQASKQLLERIFPDIIVDEKAYEDWLFKFEVNAKNYLEEIKSTKEKFSAATSSQFDSTYVEELESKNGQLQGLVAHYKTIIEDTEGMLNKLQSHVEQEEIRWRQQYDVLESQIQPLKENLNAVENLNSELKTKVKELEEKLAEKDKGYSMEVESKTCKKLIEENEDLVSKLVAEQEKIKELNKEIIKLRSTVKFDQEAYVEENKKRLELEEELKLLKSKNNLRDTPINISADFMASEGAGYERK